MKQATEHILLIRPSEFAFNRQTAASNAFQHQPAANKAMISAAAIAEFDAFAARLRSAGVHVIVFEDTEYPVKPDAVFPNNWISFHHDGTVVLYPMFAPNRRSERRTDLIDKLKTQFEVKAIIDLSGYEKEGKFLEGTGSVIFDHPHKIAYACLSPRTHPDLLPELCDKLGYRPVHFRAVDRGGKEIYHTNVMMCLSEKFAIVCMESIVEAADREALRASLAETEHRIIEISLAQVSLFAGNMLAVKNKHQEDILVMSQSAYEVLTEEQRALIAQNCLLLPMPVKTIENIGGGSARCMMAEIFLPLRKDTRPEDASF